MKPYFIFKKSLVALSVGFLLSACGHETSTSITNGYADMGALWKSLPITVCFENPAPSNSSERIWIRSRVTQEISGRTSVAFQGWGACPGDRDPIPASLIRIVLDAGWPHTEGLGNRLHNKKNGMVLATQFSGIKNKEGNPGFPGCDDSVEKRRACIEKIAVHEFGHAIGLAHEQNRPDTDPECKKQVQGSNGTETIGRFDAESIMSYCNPVWNNDGKLSLKDVHSIYHMYPDRGLVGRAAGEFAGKLVKLDEASRNGLGHHTEAAQLAPDQYGWYQRYQYGVMYWVPERAAFVVYGEIFGKYAELGYENGYGYPITDETSTPDNRGRYNHFEYGSIYWTQQTGAHEVHGMIRNKWAELGWERSIGFPKTDETGTPDGVGRYNHFERGSIYWTQAAGAHAVSGKIRQKWAEMGWERSSLGYPIDDERIIRERMYSQQNFQRGTIRVTLMDGIVHVIQR